MANDNSKGYWANLESEDLANDLSKKVGGYYQYLRTMGLLSMWVRSQRTYYGFDIDGWTHRSSYVTTGGDQGEYTLLQVNHFRNFLQHILVMATQNRPSFMAETTNDDVESRAQADVATGVFRYYLLQKNLENCAINAQERSLIKGEGFVWMFWDPDKSNDGEGDSVTSSGDVVFRDLDPDYIIRDPYQPWPNKLWCTVRNEENRWDLIAKYPELEDEIRNVSAKVQDYYTSDVYADMVGTVVSQDVVDVYYFYHERCPSLPEGRHMIYLGGEVVLYDGPLPFANIPVYRTSPGDLLDTAFGYTSAFDLLGLQSSYDAMFSSELTTYDALGIQNIIMDDNTEILPEQLRDGMNIIMIPPGAREPRSLQLATPPPGLPNFRGQIEAAMERVSGVNAVVRGDPAQSLGKGVSGSAMALIQNQALQFNSRFQRSYYNLLEDLGAGLFDMLKRFAGSRRMAAIVGEDESYKVKYFNSDVLANADVNRVSVIVGNAMENTLQGRFAMVETLAAHGLLKEPQDAFQILEYGRVRSAYKDQEAQNLLIQQENQELLKGPEVMEDGTIVGVPVLLTDDHRRHITKHTEEILTNLDARNNPDVIQATLLHIQKHIEILKTTDPEVLMALGQPSLQMQQAQELGAAGAPPQDGNAVEGSEQAPPNTPPVEG